MITKLLVANRGEIAVRIIRTARELGIATVAIYADCDAQTLAVELADEAYALGADSATDTYLNRAKIIDIARRAGADALHPGYGFLAEDAEFAAAVNGAGITWVGPKPEAIAALGDKIAAHVFAASAGVGTVAGQPDPLTGADACERVLDFARQHGYPVLIKRADLGGGRGITRLDDAAGVERFFHDHRDDPALGQSFVEKLLTHCRHVETQCLRDGAGNFAVVTTRDCSAQRRNQKVVEEAPAPFLPAATVATLEAWSHALFIAADYVGAGTCEFLVDRTGRAYFLEVNPRLQVEHTVSEDVTGIDIVREQLIIAAGGTLFSSLPEDVYSIRTGADPVFTPAGRGHAIEVRVTSEDPAADLLPATGTVTAVHWAGGPGVRIDSFLRAGDVIGGQFDSLIGKVTVWAPTRRQALARLDRVLAETEIRGIPTSIPLLRAIITDPEFIHAEGDPYPVYTKWLEDRDLLSGFTAPAPTVDTPPIPATPLRDLVIEVDGKRTKLRLPADMFTSSGESVAGHRPQPLRQRRGTTPAEAVAGSGGEVTSPMQATVVRVAVSVGQEVAAGDLVAVLEAMKMEKYLHAPVSGVVQRLDICAGQAVTAKQLLAVIEPLADTPTAQEVH